MQLYLVQSCEDLGLAIFPVLFCCMAPIASLSASCIVDREKPEYKVLQLT
jgi:hypothetical protein